MFSHTRFHQNNTKNIRILVLFVVLYRFFVVLLLVQKNNTMEATVLNDAQLELLKMMSFFSTPEALGDLKQAISNYFAKKAEDEIDRLWKNGTLTEAKVEGFRSLHERTPYPAQ